MSLRPAAHVALCPGPTCAMRGATLNSSVVLSQVCQLLAIGSHSRGFQWVAPVYFRWVSTRARACQVRAQRWVSTWAWVCRVTAQQMLPDGATKLWLRAPEPASPSGDLSAHLRSSFGGAVTDPRRGSICTSPRMKKLSACSGSPIEYPLCSGVLCLLYLLSSFMIRGCSLF